MTIKFFELTWNGRFLWLAACLFVLSAQALRAETSPWANNEGGRMRIVALAPDDSGTIRAALQIEPRPGWITYWREPGEAGIPPRITLPPGAGLTLGPIAYPVPKRVDTGALRDIGYDRAVTLPFTIFTNGAQPPVRIEASVFIGICKNICIPFQADFSLVLEPSSQTPMEENRVLAMAENAMPEKASESFSVTGYRLSPARDMLHLDLRVPPSETAPEIYLTGPDGHAFLDQKNTRLKDDAWQVDMPIAGLPKGYVFKGQTWGLLVKSGARAMETSLAFE